MAGRLGLAAALASVLLLVGCAMGEGAQRPAQGPTLCMNGTAGPITVRELVHRFAVYGIAMRRFHTKFCSEGHTVAEISNASFKVSAARRRAAVLRHGWITCDLFDSSRTITLQRLTFAHGRTAAVFMIENVSCTVYPSFQTYVGGPDRHRDQDRAVERVMQSLVY